MMHLLLLGLTKKHIKPRPWIDLESHSFHLTGLPDMLRHHHFWEKGLISRCTIFTLCRKLTWVGGLKIISIWFLLWFPITFLISGLFDTTVACVWTKKRRGFLLLYRVLASYDRQHKESNIAGFGWFWRIVQNLSPNSVSKKKSFDPWWARNDPGMKK